MCGRGCFSAAVTECFRASRQEKRRALLPTASTRTRPRFRASSDQRGSSAGCLDALTIGNVELDATIIRPTGASSVGVDGLVLAIALGLETALLHALTDQVLSNR